MGAYWLAMTHVAWIEEICMYAHATKTADVVLRYRHTASFLCLEEIVEFRICGEDRLECPVVARVRSYLTLWLSTSLLG
jgi:hypothetical protein